MKNFNEFALSERMKSVLSGLGYVEPTKVQEEAIPLILEGRDVLASSQTGTGKTGAFLIPLITKIEESNDELVLVVTPTRELAKQVQSVANQMLESHGNNISALLIGGEDMFRQMKQLKRNPKVIIGTPGRINDHLQRRTLNLKKAHYLVLDETDRMLDMGFGIQIDEILKHMPQERQTILCSATLPKAIVILSGKYLKNPARVAIGNSNSIAEKITQKKIETEEKFAVLIKELEKIGTFSSTLIFVRTQRNADKMKDKLRDYPYKVDALHGGLRQSKRERVMTAFRSNRCQVLIATDVASRGLDVPHIEHVINYDMPDNPEDYIHRIGRTARAEKTGIALSIVSSGDMHKWKAVQRFLAGDEEVLTHGSGRRKSSRKNRGGKKFGGRSEGFRDGRNSERRESGHVREGGDKRNFERSGEKRSFSRGFSKDGEGRSERREGGDRRNSRDSRDSRDLGEKRFSRSGDRKEFGGKSKSFGGKFSGGKSFGDKKFGSKSFGARFSGGKSFGRKRSTLKRVS